MAERKIALLIGLSYDNASDEEDKLNGHLDALNWAILLYCKEDYKITLLTEKEESEMETEFKRIMNMDEDDEIEERLTICSIDGKADTIKDCIIEFGWLGEDLEEDEHLELFFFFAGHGNQQNDNFLYQEEHADDEADGKDEYIVTTDDKEEDPLHFSERITDDVMFDLMVKPLHENVTLTAVFDCCRSGSILDLEYYEENGEIVKTEDSLFRQKKKGNGGLVSDREAKANVVCLSACLDKQDAREMEWGQKGYGVFSQVLGSYLRQHPRPTYQDLLEEVRQHLKENNFRQETTLSVSKEGFDLSTEFPL